MKIEIYGASDDLIEIDGDIREEFSFRDVKNERNYLAFSDGTVLTIDYTNDGMWRIAPKCIGSAVYEMVQGTDSDTDYSDHAWLTGKIEWVVHGSSMVRP
jgi:hypothetical protein